MAQESKRDDWSRLTELLEKSEARGLRALAPEELRELSRLYRSASSDLSLARARQRRDLADYLNQLVGRAHSQVYARPAGRKVQLGRFFGVQVPRTFRKCLPFWLFSLGILVVGGAISYMATISNPAWSEVLVSPGMREVMENFLQKQQPAGEYFAGTAGALGASGGLSSFLMINNIQVALMCFAFGIAWGLGTFYVLVRNALMLGSVLGLGAYHGKLLLIGAIVAPHGVVEISAVVIAGAAGLRLGYALINPGDLTRREALMVAAREAGQLALGTIPMFIFAGLVEGLISPQASGIFRNEYARLAFGAFSGMGLYTWLFAGDLMFGQPGDAEE
jgi:uncharacterized membrane protein SpoIIM required for sporulation